MKFARSKMRNEALSLFKKCIMRTSSQHPPWVAMPVKKQAPEADFVVGVTQFPCSWLCLVSVFMFMSVSVSVSVSMFIFNFIFILNFMFIFIFMFNFKHFRLFTTTIISQNRFYGDTVCYIMLLIQPNNAKVKETLRPVLWSSSDCISLNFKKNYCRLDNLSRPTVWVGFRPLIILVRQYF